MRIPIDRMTCWELQTEVYRQAELINAVEVDEHSPLQREVLLNLIGSMEDWRAELKRVMKKEREGP